MTAKPIQSAHNPEIFKSRSVLRPLSNKETMQRANAICARSSAPKTLPCSGQIFVGIFFDGTGNNEDADYTSVIDKPSEQKHSNVVRLYHAYQKEPKGTSKYYPYYIPGVGTPFPKIGDKGGKLGTGASWYGEPRLIWAITRLFNAVGNFVSDKDLIEDEQAKNISNQQGGIGSLGAQRRYGFKTTWSNILKEKIKNKPKDKPRPELINLSVFGFSRGAAEARAFVNWLYEICEEKDGGYLFAGVPLRVDFLGLFDTVASVGIAGGYTSGPIGSEGHQSWASKNMQVHQGVESCLHIVAAHEVRATFPMDSVRIEGVYPSNVKEYVYPGAHSDVGGGYHPKAQGKTDAIARIPGYEMYCAALAAGVPFLGSSQMDKKTFNVLAPTQAAVDIFRAYNEKAGVIVGPVEDMMRQHMAHYFTYRYQARNDPANNPNNLSYVKRDFYKRAKKTAASDGDPKEFMRDTQQHFIAILCALKFTLDDIMKDESSYFQYVHQPFQGQGSWVSHLGFFDLLLGAEGRTLVLMDAFDNGSRDKAADKVFEKLPAWRKWLSDNLNPYLKDSDAPERDILSVIETLTDKQLLPEIVHFFDDFVHDSMAGLAGDGVNEFLINGIGLAKFRRIFFGNRGDDMINEKMKAENDIELHSASVRRDQRAQWDSDAREYQMMTGGRY